MGSPIVDDTLKKLPFCIAQDSTGTIVHAVYRYETVACFILLIAMLICMEIMKKRLSGDVLLLTMVLYGCTMVLMESLRDDGHMIVHFVHIQQVIALLLPVISVVIWTFHGKKKGIPGKKYIIPHLMVIIGVVGIICMEFLKDHSEDLILDYTIMLLFAELLCIGAIFCHRLQMTDPETLERRKKYGARKG